MAMLVLGRVFELPPPSYFHGPSSFCTSECRHLPLKGGPVLQASTPEATRMTLGPRVMVTIMAK